LLALDAEPWRHALGLAGTQAAGLKSGFGTMAKPLHAGRAAANGLTSALLARRGFTGNTHILETKQGFAATHGASHIDPERLGRCDGQFLITSTLFKYHASCYLTHAAIEAASRLRCTAGFSPGDVEHVEVRASAACTGVCDIAEPETGLAGKFSLRATTAMALLGIDTSDPATFSDERMRDPQLVAMRHRTSFVPQPHIPGTRAAVVVRVGGRELQAEADTGIPATDLNLQWRALSAKFTALASSVIGHGRTEALLALIARLEAVPSMRELTKLAGGEEPP
jgi:2-methylcitrate dehydratase PrpD